MCVRASPGDAPAWRMPPTAPLTCGGRKQGSQKRELSVSSPCVSWLAAVSTGPGHRPPLATKKTLKSCSQSHAGTCAATVLRGCARQPRCWHAPEPATFLGASGSGSPSPHPLPTHPHPSNGVGLQQALASWAASVRTPKAQGVLHIQPVACLHFRKPCHTLVGDDRRWGLRCLPKAQRRSSAARVWRGFRKWSHATGWTRSTPCAFGLSLIHI